jgi:hypothetical protein
VKGDDGFAQAVFAGSRCVGERGDENTRLSFPVQALAQNGANVSGRGQQQADRQVLNHGKSTCLNLMRLIRVAF